MNWLEMNWGSVEAARKMLSMISTHEGLGDLLADGIISAAGRIGVEVANLAIYSKK